jgi:hypothetical protein
VVKLDHAIDLDGLALEQFQRGITARGVSAWIQPAERLVRVLVAGIDEGVPALAHEHGALHKACTWPVHRTVLNMRTGVGDGITFDQNANAARGQFGRRKGPPKAVIKEVIGIHVLLTRSLFGDGILRRLIRRVSLAESTSAPLRF